MQGVFGQGFTNGLGHAEIDDLGEGFALLIRHDDIRRFDVPMYDTLLVRVLDCLADFQEQGEACFNGQLMLVAVVGDGQAFNKLHDKKGSPAKCHACIVDMGNVGMIEKGQYLALRLEMGNDLFRVHARLDHL